jgi:hypothetical protein
MSKAITQKAISNLLNVLETSKVLVQFTNAAGELKEMTCTLSPDLIPQDQQVPKLSLNEVLSMADPLGMVPLSIPTDKAVDPNLIKVYSIDRGGWRSFRLERVTSITISPE